MNFSNRAEEIRSVFRCGTWRKVFDSSDPRWLGPGATSPDQVAGPDDTLRLPPTLLVVYARSTG
jgi:hypothetical protein